jgi:N-ethylmaleimide reductase
MNYPSLFSPFKVGPYQLQHRLVLAPLTRMRAAKPSLALRVVLGVQRARRRADC